jgi:ATP-binding cassette, subfamily F, member 3
VSALAQAVKSFQGAVVVVSHDQYFVNEVANEVWVVGDQRVKQVASFDAYRKKQLQQLKA